MRSDPVGGDKRLISSHALLLAPTHPTFVNLGLACVCNFTELLSEQDSSSLSTKMIPQAGMIVAIILVLVWRMATPNPQMDLL